MEDDGMNACFPEKLHSFIHSLTIIIDKSSSSSPANFLNKKWCSIIIDPQPLLP
jgi:hypothetical protein